MNTGTATVNHAGFYIVTPYKLRWGRLFAEPILDHAEALSELTGLQSEFPWQELRLITVSEYEGQN